MKDLQFFFSSGVQAHASPVVMQVPDICFLEKNVPMLSPITASIRMPNVSKIVVMMGANLSWMIGNEKLK